MALEYVNLTLDLQDGSGTPISKGTATCVLSNELLDTVEHADIVMAPITVPFTTGGNPAVSLVANDSPNLPAGSTWTISFSGVPGNPRIRTFSLSHGSGSDQYLSDQTDAQPTANMASFLQGSYSGDGSQVLNGVGQWVSLPSEPIASVNGKTGTVVLTASDVGADPSGTAGAVSTALTADIDALLVATLTATSGVALLVDGSYVVQPGALLGITRDDAVAINAAFGYLPTQADPDTGVSLPVGTVRLASGIFTINTQVTKPASVNLVGSGPGTVLNVNGSITGVYTHGVKPPVNGQQHNTKCGTIAHMIINGVGNAANAIGLDVGDGWGHSVEHVWCQNFTGTNAIGLMVCNRNFYTEKFRAHHVSLINNATAVMHATVTTDSSNEYQDVEYYIFASSDQNGIVIRGVNFNGSMKMRGNFLKGLGANSILTLVTDPGGAGDAFMRGHIDITCEENPGTSGTVSSAAITFGDANQKLYASGYLRFESGATNAVPGNLQFRGAVWMGTTTVQAITTPTLPATTVAFTNNQHDAAVYVHGGTVTVITVNGVITGITSGMVYVPIGGTIAITYSAAPTWKWISAL